MRWFGFGNKTYGRNYSKKPLRCYKQNMCTENRKAIGLKLRVLETFHEVHKQMRLPQSAVIKLYTYEKGSCFYDVVSRNKKWGRGGGRVWLKMLKRIYIRFFM